MRENIHYCTEKDFKEIYPLLKQLWPKNSLNEEALRSVFSKAVNSSDQVYINYRYKDKIIVGFCTMTIKNNLWQHGNIAHIDELVVDEKYRRKGIGKKLLTEVVLIARFRGCKRIELDSAFHRKKAHFFYEELGFENRAYLFSKVL